MTALLSLGRLFAPGVVALLAFAAPADEPSGHTKDPLPSVQKKLDEKKAVLLDVREKKEWDAGHLAAARLVPLTELRDNLDKPEYVARLKKSLPTDKPIYVHCKAGGRCVLAADALRKELGPGYDFRALKPGYDDLVKAGFKKAEPKPAGK